MDNDAALALYASLGFIREKRLYRFYMNGKDAFRLVLPVIPDESEHALGMVNPSSTTTTTSAPISIPSFIRIKIPKDMGSPMATLETPPSPLYPIHAHRAATRAELSTADLSASSSFSTGGMLATASPRSVGSHDSFVLYGAHIPSSISPPLPPRPANVATPPRRVPREDDESYVSGR